MSTITTERLTKILSETQAVISECNSRGVHGSVEVNARLFENVLMELLLHRAAMLQGADGNSPVIQDGSEDTKRLDWLEAQNKRLNEYYGTTYGWKFDANFQRNAMMLNDSNYPVMTVRQAIDEAIAAAPQQEVTAKPKK
ncbi:hypothetical protein [Enterobacter hormaechei]|uniref:hypothetical protein n=1 Tax=Enterobacter hormaechei TaxID=158836 RepID=UPI000D6FEC32|nr:hypothetical protein [Enterobacter hormaechei]